MQDITWKRVVYMLGIYMSFLNIFLLGYDLHYAKIFHIVKFFVLIPFRLIEFKKQKKHYYMFEFCYVANMIVALYLIGDLMGFNMDSLFILMYSLAFGPSIWAIFVNKDRMYFHSPQHLISVFIHMDPSLLAWMIRWNNNSIDMEYLYPPELSYDNIFTTYKMFLAYAMPVYCLWAVCYYVWMFIIRRHRIYDSNYKTAFRDLTRNTKHIGKKFIHITKLPIINEILYMLFHCLSSFVSVCVASVLFNSYILNTLMVIALFTATSWHASYKYVKLIIQYEDVNKKN
jgi:hypothetical protein